METRASPTERARPAPRARLRGRLAGFITMLLLAISLPSGAVAPVEREYADAVKSFRSGRTADAFGRFIELANRGDVDAARIALFLHSYGAVLFDKHWEADPRDVAYWNMLIRNSGTSARPSPQFPPTVLNPAGPKARAAVARPRTANAITRVAAD